MTTQRYQALIPVTCKYGVRIFADVIKMILGYLDGSLKISQMSFKE